MTLLLLAAGLGGQALLGVVVVALCLRTSVGRASSPSIGSGVALSPFLVALAQLVWSLAGGALGSGLSWTLAALGWGTGGWLFALRRCRRRAERDDSSPAALQQPGCSLRRFLQGGVAVALLSCTVLTVLTPQRFWDERAIFGIKGLVITGAGLVDAAPLRDPDFVQGHPRYPLLLPLAEANIAALLGGFDDRWAKLIAPLLFAGLVLAFAGVIGEVTTAEAGWLWALLLAMTPVLFPFELGFISAQADAPVAALHGLSVLWVWKALRVESSAEGTASTYGPWLLAGLFAAAAAFTKDEGTAHGLVQVVTVALAWLIGRLTRRARAMKSHDAASAADAFSIRRWLTRAGLAGVVAAIALLPWLIHRRALPSTTEMGYWDRLSLGMLADRLDALAWMLPHLAGRMWREWSAWGIHWWVLLAALVTMPRRAARPEQAYLLLQIAGSIAALLVAGMIAPAELEDHIGGSSQRYLMQLAPTAWLFTAGQWFSPASGPGAPGSVRR